MYYMHEIQNIHNNIVEQRDTLFSKDFLVRNKQHDSIDAFVCFANFRLVCIAYFFSTNFPNSYK